MGTQRFLICSDCGRFPAKGQLFKLLLRQAGGAIEQCPKCQKVMALGLTFSFGLNAPFPECTVRDCFSPRKPQSWTETDGSLVTFYPFLVVLNRHGKDLAAWLPYWHVVARANGPQYKYGQWAPFMDARLFQDLLQQAQSKGYFSNGLVAGAP